MTDKTWFESVTKGIIVLSYVGMLLAFFSDSPLPVMVMAGGSGLCLAICAFRWFAKLPITSIEELARRQR